jgi:hypothetical protein
LHGETDATQTEEFRGERAAKLLEEIMNRIVFALALVSSVASASNAAFAQERVAHAGTTAKPARAIASARADQKAKSKAAAPTGATLRTSSGNGTTLSAPTDSGVVTSHPGVDLADVHGQASTSSGPVAQERTITVAAVTEAKVSRMLATPRLLRRMGADKTVAKLAEDFRACYAQDSAAKTAPDAVVRVEVDATGLIDQANVESGAKATGLVRGCILAATGAAKFNAPGGAGAAVLIQVRTH